MRVCSFRVNPSKNFFLLFKLPTVLQTFDRTNGPNTITIHLLLPQSPTNVYNLFQVSRRLLYPSRNLTLNLLDPRPDPRQGQME